MPSQATRPGVPLFTFESPLLKSEKWGTPGCLGFTSGGDGGRPPHAPLHGLCPLYGEYELVRGECQPYHQFVVWTEY